ERQRDDHGQAEDAAGEDRGVAQVLAQELRHRRVEHDRSAEITMDEPPDPGDVPPPEGLIVAVLLEPEITLLECRIEPKDLGGDIVLVALEQQEQDQRNRQHDEDHGRETSKCDPKHGFPGSCFLSNHRQKTWPRKAGHRRLALSGRRASYPSWPGLTWLDP